MNYEQFLAYLNDAADEKYRRFHTKLLKNDEISVLGVTIPKLRKAAKLFKGREDELMSFPDEFYEVTFVKLSAVALLPYDRFIGYVDRCVGLIDNWATCDGFSPKCISLHRDEFLPYIQKYLAAPREFSQRFAITTLLSYYMEQKYLDIIFSCCQKADTSMYYVHMGVAWLIAEVLVKFYADGVQFLKSNALTAKTHNKAIQKAKESYRLTSEQKINLNKLKR